MTDSSTGPDWYRLLVHNVEGFALFVVDPDGIVQTWNPGAEALFGWTEGEIVGQTCKVLWTPEDLEVGADRNERQTAALAGEAPDERWHVRRDGSRVYVHGVTSAIHNDGKVVGFAKVARDAAMREHTFEALLGWGRAVHRPARRVGEAQVIAALQQALDAERAEVRRLTGELPAALAEAVAGEQRRIAAVLHDDLQQLLVGASMQVKTLRDHGATEEVAAPAERVARTLDRAIASTRSLTARLVPPDVLTAPLPRALGWLARNVSETYGLDIDLDIGDVDGGPGHAALEGHIRLLIFEAVRELLFNIVKHAKTGGARVSARATGRVLTVVVEDRGVGVAEDAEPGYGLAAVRRHLGAVGGALRVGRLPGGGTRAVVRVPRDPLDPPRPQRRVRDHQE
ncbi:MAG TPA: PAS domain S-box protein [Rubricoccaceae bacterium]|jgi:PAS domain S-box-containing protein